MLFVFCPTLSPNMVHITAQNSSYCYPFNAKTFRHAYYRCGNNAYNHHTTTFTWLRHYTWNSFLSRAGSSSISIVKHRFLIAFVFRLTVAIIEE